MSRKDYVKIASAIALARSINRKRNADSPDNREEIALNDVSVFIADSLATDNPRFNRDRFYKACGLSND